MASKRRGPMLQALYMSDAFGGGIASSSKWTPRKDNRYK
jgi:hypothetical protein